MYVEWSLQWYAPCWFLDTFNFSGNWLMKIFMCSSWLHITCEFSFETHKPCCEFTCQFILFPADFLRPCMHVCLGFKWYVVVSCWRANIWNATPFDSGSMQKFKCLAYFFLFPPYVHTCFSYHFSFFLHLPKFINNWIMIQKLWDFLHDVPYPV